MYDDNARNALYAHVSTEARPVKLYQYGSGLIAIGPGGAQWIIPSPAYQILLNAAGIAGPNVVRVLNDEAELGFLVMIRGKLNPDPVISSQIDAVLALSEEDAQRIASAIQADLADGVADELAERLKS